MTLRCLQSWRTVSSGYLCIKLGKIHNLHKSLLAIYSKTAYQPVVCWTSVTIDTHAIMCSLTPAGKPGNV